MVSPRMVRTARSLLAPIASNARRRLSPMETMGTSSVASAVRAGFEAVADVANCLNVPRLVRVFFYLGAQRGYASINAAGRHDNGVPPDRVQDVIARQSAAASRDEIREQPK